MFRLLLALLLTLGFGLAPMAAASASVACDHSGGMAMMASGPAASASADPCCDHGDQHGKKMNAACAQACASTCGVTVAMAGCAEHVVFIASRATLAPAPVAQSHPYEPPGLKRPPRLIG